MENSQNKNPYVLNCTPSRVMKSLAIPPCPTQDMNWSFVHHAHAHAECLSVT